MSHRGVVAVKLDDREWQGSWIPDLSYPQRTGKRIWDSVREAKEKGTTQKLIDFIKIGDFGHPNRYPSILQVFQNGTYLIGTLMEGQKIQIIPPEQYAFLEWVYILDPDLEKMRIWKPREKEFKLIEEVDLTVAKEPDWKELEKRLRE